MSTFNRDRSESMQVMIDANGELQERVADLRAELDSKDATIKELESQVQDLLRRLNVIFFSPEAKGINDEGEPLHHAHGEVRIYGKTGDDCPVCQQATDAKAYRKELEECVQMVLAFGGLATGHADTHAELMHEVLRQVEELRKRIAELEAALDEVCEFVDFDAADDARCASAEPLETLVNRALEG